MPARRPPAVARVLERVTATVRRHDLIEPGSRVLLAVSGGPDSMAMLHAMHSLRRLLRIRTSVVHVDHGVRPESADDAAYVERAAARLGLAAAVYRVRRAIPRGTSPEAWLREQRYRLFEHALRDTDSNLLATAHTADDLAETVLMAALRGGGLDAVAGIPPRRDAFVRPLLEVTRAETLALCRSLRLRPRRDPMNEDRRFLRVALREEAIPALERATGRRAVEPLVRTAGLLRADAAFLDSLADDAEPEVVLNGPGGLRLRATALRALAGPVAGRVAHRALRRAGVEPATGHVEAVLDLAAGRPGRTADLPGGLIASRDRSYVRLAKAPPRRTSSPDRPTSAPRARRTP